jgi:fibrillarin-like pre-rRNA processing protein
MNVKPHKIKGVYLIDNSLATRGSAIYGENTFGDYRFWDPRRSKLAALIRKKGDLAIESDQKVLYLGAASGTTVSHLSDIVTLIYAVELSFRVARDLIKTCESRRNIIPLISDASKPDYDQIVELVDIIYQDVAQRQQAEIAMKNAEMFLKAGGHAFIMIKARSIDVTADPREIYKFQIKKLEEMFDIEAVRELEPFHKDHAAVIAKIP